MMIRFNGKDGNVPNDIYKRGFFCHDVKFKFEGKENVANIIYIGESGRKAYIESRGIVMLYQFLSGKDNAKTHKFTPHIVGKIIPGENSIECMHKKIKGSSNCCRCNMPMKKADMVAIGPVYYF